MLKKIISIAISTFCLLALALPARAAIIREETMDTNLNGFEARGQTPTHDTSFSRIGAGSMHNRLDRSSGDRRSMVQLDTNPDYVFPDAPGANVWKANIGSEYWYALSVYVPANWQPLTWNGGNAYPSGGSGGELLYQHQAYPDSGEMYRSPVLAIYIDYGRTGGMGTASNPYYRVVIRGDDRTSAPSSPSNFPYSVSKDIQAVLPDRGHWVDWVFHVRWNWQNGGNSFVQVYRRRDDGGWVEVITRSEFAGQPNCSRDQYGPYHSFGPYIWDWADSSLRSQSDIDRREYWYDHLRIGDANSSLTEVAPGGGGEVVPPPPPPDEEPPPEEPPTEPPSDPGILPPAEPTNPPVVDIQANGSDVATTVRAGEQALLSWISVDAINCTASGDWKRTKSLSGQETTDRLYSSKIYTLTCLNAAGSASDSVIVNISDPNFSVFLEAFPSTGIVPLTNVDLRATVYGTAEGPVTYYFHCNYDASWNRQVVSENSTFTVSDLCDYDTEGTYTALVRVEREGNVATDTVNIRVSKPNLVIVNPENQIITGQPEATVSIDILNTAGLHDFSFDVVYDSSILLFKSLQRSTFIGSPDETSWSVDTSTGGRVHVVATRTDDGYVNGSGTLATINFTVIKTGVSGITIENLKLHDEGFNEISPSGPVNGQIIVRSTATPPWWTTYKTGTARLVRCGLSYDDPETEIDERCPCTLCHLFILFRVVLDFVLKLVFAVAAFFATLGGLYFIFGAPSPATVSKGREILKSVAIGLVAVFSAWLIVNLIFMFIGVAEWTRLRENWFQITCDIVCKR